MPSTGGMPEGLEVQRARVSTSRSVYTQRQWRAGVALEATRGCVARVDTRFFESVVRGGGGSLRRPLSRRRSRLPSLANNTTGAPQREKPKGRHKNVHKNETANRTTAPKGLHLRFAIRCHFVRISKDTQVTGIYSACVKLLAHSPLSSV